MNAAAIANRYDFAATLIADAGALSLGYFRDQSSLEIASKGLQDMASQADLETERLIRDRIAAARKPAASRRRRARVCGSSIR